MKQVFITFAAVLVAASLQLGSSVPDLEQKYPFATDLEEGYRLYWDFDLQEQKIAIAVNVSTNGWIGFGISPTGKMEHSDIVVGWVNKDGTAQFHVSSYIIILDLAL